jgi:hypothetical protein
VRTCTDCGQVKPTSEFTPIRGTPWYYGRCKVCRAARARRPRPEDEAPLPAGFRRCTDCGSVKREAAFVRIRFCKQGWYGRCRACRARRARERYQADPIEREM